MSNYCSECLVWASRGFFCGCRHGLQRYKWYRNMPL